MIFRHFPFDFCLFPIFFSFDFHISRLFTIYIFLFDIFLFFLRYFHIQHFLFRRLTPNPSDLDRANMAYWCFLYEEVPFMQPEQLGKLDL